MQRRLLDTLQEYNQGHQAPRADNSNLAARISSYELAFRMQTHATEAVELQQETEMTRRLYGIDNPVAAARAMIELLTSNKVQDRTAA